MKKIAIFIPAYDEERSIGSVVLLAKKYGKVYVVDDGSADRTGQIAREAGATVIGRESNGGYGAALGTAVKHAKKTAAEVIVFIDGDFQHEPLDIMGVAGPVLSGRADVALGSRFKGKFVGAPTGRKEGVGFINRLSGVQSGKGALDYQCGFRAFSKKALARIPLGDSGYSTCAQMIISAQEANLKIVEVPVAVRYFEGANDGALSQAAGLVKYAVSEIAKKKPLFYFGGAGTALLVISLLLGIFVVETFYGSGKMPIGSALLCVFFGIVGFVFMLIGINLYTLQALMGNRRD